MPPTNPELSAFCAQLTRLVLPEALFGTPMDPARLKKRYRQFCKIAHADRYIIPADKSLAQEAFTRLTALYHEAEARLAAGIYGTARPTRPATIITKRTTYAVTEAIAAGDLATIYRATDADGAAVVIKLARSRRDNDLLQVEAQTIAALQAAAAGHTFCYYLPQVVETFTTKHGVDPGRRANVLVTPSSYVPLLDVLAQYPDGWDPRHSVWVLNRLLGIFAFVHAQGYVHGAVLPAHVLIDPATHGLILIDWCFATKLGEPIRAVSDAYRDWYPPEVLAKRPATAATDIFMAARTIRATLADSRRPASFHRFLRSCLLTAQARRPQDAFALLESFRQTTEMLYGPPRFVPLEFEETAKREA